ncbi:hypothetical protein [Desulfonatronovibrio magnus]|uniref:hypothetical protein n=1 Tax=Desulfonatronovibrio magnus TaxID=698827 RepID=UPI0005EBEA84|nr:hypothetical protein [Desulfonatronovibrio magnus]
MKRIRNKPVHRDEWGRLNVRLERLGNEIDMAEPHLIDHYEWQVQGLSQKSMAGKMGLNQCGLSQKKSAVPAIRS